MTRNGLWVLAGGRERFMPYDQFPWFRGAPVEAVFNVEEPRAGHLHWPDLDIDIEVESIEHPDRYPLVTKASTRTSGRARPIADSR